jgi:hypothetical protein
VIFIEAILMGIFATFIMDLFAGFLVKRKFIHSFIAPEAVGRWFLYMFRGKFVHQDILKTPALRNEKFWCVISHFLIGIVLAGIYLFLELKEPTIRDQMWIPPDIWDSNGFPALVLATSKHRSWLYGFESIK